MGLQRLSVYNETLPPRGGEANYTVPFDCLWFYLKLWEAK